jgi:hypothetical protein
MRVNPPQQEVRVLMPTVTGEVHRPQARFSPVSFTEYPRFLMPTNTRKAVADGRASS